MVATWASDSRAESSAAKALDQFKRDMCQHLPGLKCKPAVRSRASRTTGQKASGGAAAATAPEAAPTAKDDIVLPRFKPQPASRETEVSGPASSAVPLPRFKPARPSETAPVAPRKKPLTKVSPEDLTGGSKPQQPGGQATSVPENAQLPADVLPSAIEGRASLLPTDAEKEPSRCLAMLKQQGVVFQPAATPVASGGCTIETAVQLRAVPVKGGSISLPDQPLLNCAYAVRFAQWLREQAAPGVRQASGSDLTALYTGPGFQCRGRNGDVTSKLSEHAYGNAVDVERLKLANGTTFLVKDAPDTASPAYATLKVLRASACKYFTTVLGPGANAAHAEHFHFDLGRHGKSGTYVICE